jgi:RHS repeat-associated protein
MKQSLLSKFLAPLICSLAAPTYAAVVSGDGDSSRTNTRITISNQYVIAKSGNGQTWESVKPLTNLVGTVTYKTNYIQELATGMHYFDTNAGQWKPSDPTFTDNLDSFIALKVQAKVTLKKDLNVGGSVFVTTPDQKQIYSTPVALGLFDPVTGAFAVIGEITNCTGTLVSSNMIVYDRPFSDGDGGRLCGSLVYTIGQATFEQDYIWTANLNPQLYGFNSNCWVQVISEIQSAPEADILERPVYIEQDEAKRQQTQTPDIFDQTVGWGELVLGPGKAYMIGADGQTMNPIADVHKELRREPSRSLLIESVPFGAISANLATLGDCQPQTGSHAQAAPRVLKNSYASIASPPKPARTASLSSKNPETARLNRRPAGVSIDYIQSIGGTLGSATVFSSSTNWYVSSAVTCNGTVTIEGGAIFRYKTNTSILLNNTLTLRGNGMYRPIIFTALDDTSLGDAMNTTIAPSYTGIINPGGYANPALNCANSVTLSNCRFCYAKAAFANPSASGVTVTVNHSQLINCIKGVSLTYSGCGSASAVTINLNNVLMTSVGTPIELPSAGSSVVTLLNCTIDHSTLWYSGAGTFKATNSIFANITDTTVSPAGDHNGFYNAKQFGGSSRLTTASPFQTVGGGSNYISGASVFRDIGTTAGLSSSLLADLRLRTTYPPSVTSQTALSPPLPLSPAVKRDTDTLDLGYHYDPIDYALGGATLGTVVNVLPGTVIATFGPASSSSGVTIGSGGQFICTGTATQAIWIVEYNTVQEANGTWQRTSAGSLNCSGQDQTAPISCRFTDFSMMSLDDKHVRATSGSGLLNFRDCEFYGGLLLSTGPTMNFTNCLFERLETDLEPPSGAATSYFHNNTFWGGKFGYGPVNSEIKDNLFDKVTIPDWIGGRGNTYTGSSGGKNGYITGSDQLHPTDANAITLSASPTYKTGPLGRYYLVDTTTQLINQGSTTADLVSLYHYTVKTNLTSGYETEEGTSTVSVGYHYVAVGPGNAPIDNDGDSIADYLEDANGNGIIDPSENSYRNPIINLSAYTPAFQEGQLAQNIDPNATITAWSANFNHGILTAEITANPDLEDTLSILPTGSISLVDNSIKYGPDTIGSYFGGSKISPLVIRFNSDAATKNAVAAVLDSLAFYNGSDAPTNLTRTVRYTLTDGKGGTSSPVTKNIPVTAVNDAPIITLSSGATTYSYFGPSVIIDPSAGIFDADSPDFNGGALTITTTLNAEAGDRLEVVPSISAPLIATYIETGTLLKQVTYNGVIFGTITSDGSGTSSLAISFNAQATLAAVDALIRRIGYRSATQAPSYPSTLPRTIQFSVTDGDTGVSASKTKEIDYDCFSKPRDIMIVIDHSGSMATDSRLDKAKTAATDFVKSLELTRDKVGVIQFSAGNDLLIGLSSVEGDILSTISGITIDQNAGTAIGPAVDLAHSNLPVSPPTDHDRIIVFLTDGQDYPTDTDPLQHAQDAKDDLIRIITVGLSSNVNVGLLQGMATSSSDYWDAYTSPNTIASAMTGIAQALCRDTNHPPVVSAGSSQCVVLGVDGTAAVTLTATADDNPSQTLNYFWSWISGPGPVEFTGPNSPSTSAKFNLPGTYKLRFMANDGSLSASDDVNVFVFANGTTAGTMVDAGPAQTIVLGQSAQLKGSVGTPSGDCTPSSLQWTVDAPSGVTLTFSPNATTLNPVVSGFPGVGQYTLRLTATYNSVSSYDTVTIGVCNQQQPPTDIFLLLDESGSMGASLGEVRQAANRFIDTLDLTANRVAVLPFSVSPYLIQPLTNDATVLHRCINSLENAGGGTDMAAALNLAFSEIKNPQRARGAFPVILILSDGDPDNMVTANAAANEAKFAGVRIICAGVGTTTTGSPNLLELASSQSDWHILNPDEIVPFFEDLSSAGGFCGVPNRRPVVFLGPDRKVDLTKPVTLTVGVYDEDPPEALTYQWSVESPLGANVVFTPVAGNPLKFTATGFQSSQSYLLELQVTDTQGAIGTAELTLQHGIGSLPAPQDDAIVVASYAAGQSPASTLIDVLANDQDPDGDHIAIKSVTSGQYGTAEVINNGAFLRYTPHPDQGGVTDTIVYDVTDGKDGVGSARVSIFLLPLHYPPIANNDLFLLAAGDPEIQLTVLDNDTELDPAPPPINGSTLQGPAYLRIISMTAPAVGQGTIRAQDMGSGKLAYFYTPPSTALADPVVLNYTISDQYGQTASATITIAVLDSPNHQVGTVTADPASLTIESDFPYDSRVNLTGRIVEDGRLSGGYYQLEWQVDVPTGGRCDFPQQDGPTAVVSLLGDGTYTFRLILHEFNQAGTETTTPNPPTAVFTVNVVRSGLLADMRTPHDGDIVGDGILTVTGTAYEPNATYNAANFSYSFELYKGTFDPANLINNFTFLDPPPPAPAEQRVAPRDPPGKLGTLDLSRLENGPYVLRLKVNGSSSQTHVDRSFILDSRLKLGRFAFNVQDVVIPFGGLQLAVNRSYDSFNSRRGEFGYGWTYALGELGAEIDETRAPEQDIYGRSVSVRSGGGRDVTLTLPNGERTTFYFTLRPGVGYQYAEWVAAPGVFAKLEPIDDNRLSVIGTITWQAGDYHTPYENFDFSGFILTTLPDGTRYELRRQPLGGHWFGTGSGLGNGAYVNAFGDLKLKSITRPDNERVVFNDDRIEHYDAASPNTPGATIFLKHEDSTFPGLITAVFDPNTAGGLDPVVRYTYSNGDLTKVERLMKDRLSGGPAYSATTYHYDFTASPHYISSIDDPRGQGIHVATTHYDDKNRIDFITDGRGRQTTFTYDLPPAANTTEVGGRATTDYLGNSTQQFFDSRGNVARVLDPLQNETDRTFDQINNLTREVQIGAPTSVALPIATDYKSDLQGNRTRSVQHVTLPAPMDLETQYHYNDFGQVTTVADPNTVAANPNHPEAVSTINVYEDLTGRLLFTTNALSQVTSYTYFGSGDPNYGRLQQVTDPLGNYSLYAYDPRGNASSVTMKNAANQTLTTTTYTYDANNNRLTETITRTLPSGSTDTATTRYRYDPQNRLIQTIDPLLFGGSTVYNTVGKVAESADKLGNVTQYFYDAVGELARTVYPDGSLADRITTTETISGQLTKIEIVEDPYFPGATETNGTRTVYDKTGRAIETGRLEHVVMVCAISGEVATIDENPAHFSYHPIPNSASLTEYNDAYLLRVLTDANGNTSTSYYDEANRLIQVDRPRNHDPFPVIETTLYLYDQNGNQTNSYMDYFDASGQEVRGLYVTNTFDPLNRQVAVGYPNVSGVHDPATGSTNQTTTIYDDAGRVIKQTDQAGISTGFGYDGAGRLIRVTNAFNLDDQTVTWYFYDEAGNMTRQLDAEGRNTYFEYDSLGHRTKRTLPGGQIEYFTYDQNGNQVAHIDFNTNQTTFQYDSMNRLTNKIAAPVFNQSIAYTYTPFGARFTVFDTLASHVRQTTNYYDNQNRLFQKLTPEGSITYGYDNNGNVTSASSDHTGGYSVGYTWDAFNRLSTVTDQNAPGGPATTTYSYDDLDRLAECDYPSATGVKHNYQYNEANWLSRVQVLNSGGTPGDFQYAFDTASPLYTGFKPGRTGARTSVTATVNGTAQNATYNYDQLYRLNKESLSGGASGDITYDGTAGYGDSGGFDKVGNRRSRTSTVSAVPGASYSYNSNDRLTSDTYDANGNTTVAGGFTYTYDFENRLRTRNSSPWLAFGYDQDGNRVTKTNGTTVTTFLVDEHTPTGYAQVVEETTAGTITVYNWGLRILNSRVGSTVQYYAHDGHFNVRLLLDSDGTVNMTYAYDAFGNIVSGSAPSSGSAYLYCGEQFDVELSMYYLRARYYNQDRGRFWTSDNFEGNKEDPTSLHKYAFCNDNPVGVADPSGHEGEFIAEVGEFAFFAQAGAAAIAKKVRQVTVHIYFENETQFQLPEGNLLSNLSKIGRGKIAWVLHSNPRPQGTPLGWFDASKTRYVIDLKFKRGIAVPGNIAADPAGIGAGDVAWVYPEKLDDISRDEGYGPAGGARLLKFVVIHEILHLFGCAHDDNNLGLLNVMHSGSREVLRTWLEQTPILPATAKDQVDKYLGVW